MTNLNIGAVVTINGQNFEVTAQGVVPTTRPADPSEFEAGQVWKAPNGEIFMVAEAEDSLIALVDAELIDIDSGETPQRIRLSYADSPLSLSYLGHGMEGLAAHFNAGRTNTSAPTNVANQPRHALTAGRWRLGRDVYEVHEDGTATRNGERYSASMVAAHAPQAVRVEDDAPTPQPGQTVEVYGQRYLLTQGGGAVNTRTGDVVDAATVQNYIGQAIIVG